MNEKELVAKYIRDALSELYWVTSSLDENCEFVEKEELEKIEELQNLLKSIYIRINK